MTPDAVVDLIVCDLIRHRETMDRALRLIANATADIGHLPANSRARAATRKLQDAIDLLRDELDDEE